MTLYIPLALAFWMLGIVTAIGSQALWRAYRRHKCLRNIAAMNDAILAKRFVEHRGELARRRQLREFIGNASVVELKRGKDAA